MLKSNILVDFRYLKKNASAYGSKGVILILIELFLSVESLEVILFDLASELFVASGAHKVRGVNGAVKADGLTAGGTFYLVVFLVLTAVAVVIAAAIASVTLTADAGLEALALVAISVAIAVVTVAVAVASVTVTAIALVIVAITAIALVVHLVHVLVEIIHAL